MKVYHCRDAGFECKLEIHGDDKEEILRLAEIHALKVHGQEPSDQMRKDMERLVRNEKHSPADDVKMNQ